MGDAELREMYARYLRHCNEHRFTELGEFVADDVLVNDAATGLQGYIEGLQSVVATYPDFRWDLRELLVDGSRLSARLIDTGRPRGGSAITLQEFAMYRIDHGRIAAAWGDLDPPRLPT